MRGCASGWEGGNSDPCVPAGTRADVSPDQVATVLWKYFTELGSNAKETVDQLQQAEITKQLK